MSFSTPIQRLIKFTVVGLSVAAFHYGMAVLLVEVIGLHPAPANSAAFLMAALLSYTLQTLWTFESRFTARNAARFVMVILLGVLVSWTTSTLVGILGWPYRVGVLLVLVLIPGLNFVLHYAWTYAETSRATRS